MDELPFIRQIFFYKNHFLDFYKNQTDEVKKKFNWTLQLIATVQNIPRKYFQNMEGSQGLFEIRVEVGSDIFRAFAFFDKGNLIIVANAFQKKTQKTPKNEIEKADIIRKAYFYEKTK
jgi:phage-related protein